MIFHIIDPRQFSRADLDQLCELTTLVRTIAKERRGAAALQNLLAHRRMMLYFSQPSTRTFLSFNNACHILGIRTSEIRDSSTSSEIKGETIEDSIRTFSSYVDAIVMRTWEEGLAQRSAQMLDRTPRPIPIINAGSGKDLHPTQALLDIYTLERSFESRGGVSGKVIGMMGDLRRGRTVRSLCYLLANYAHVRLIFIAPQPFTISEDVKDFLTHQGVEFSATEHLHDVLPQLDAIYITRMQSEYDTQGESAAVDLARFSFGVDELARLKPDGIIMHPLPRRTELHVDVDSDPRAMYWRQERNGMWMRVALLVKIFGADQELMVCAQEFRRAAQ